jgi:hypothetical protein
MAKGRRKSTPSLDKLQAEIEEKLAVAAASPELRALGERLRDLGARAQERRAAAPLLRWDPEASEKLTRYLRDPYGVKALVRELKKGRTAPKRTGNDWRQEPIKKVIRDLRASGELRKTMAKDEQLRRLGNELERRGIRGSPTTQRRALGFRKN